MSRRKKATARGWEATNKQREEANKTQESEKPKEVTEEEHEKKMKLLEEIGLIENNE